MKRLLIVLFVFSLLTSTCLAEKFSVRNGIQFGLSPEEVVNIEREANGEDIEVTDYSELAEIMDISQFSTSISFETNIAGFDNCSVGYIFDDNDKLRLIQYGWTWDGSVEDKAKNSSGRYTKSSITPYMNPIIEDYKHKYEVFENALSNKYEEIGGLVNGKINFVDFGNYDDAYYLYFIKQPDKYYDMYGFKQYLEKDEDNYVEILVYSFRSETDNIVWGYSTGLYCGVKYISRSEELVNSLNKKAEDLKNKIDSDL